jgi:hypothetical protein
MFEITAWYEFRGAKRWNKYEVNADCLSDAFRKVLSHMAGGFYERQTDHHVIPDRVLISGWRCV